MDNQVLLDEQYDVVAGHWPENKNEVVLVIDKNNEISDFTLYTLGIRMLLIWAILLQALGRQMSMKD